jgi:hypothetical protein
VDPPLRVEGDPQGSDEHFKCHKIRVSQIVRKQSDKFIDQYEIDILSDQEIVRILRDSVSRTHHIMVKTDMLLKYWILSKYHQDPNSLPRINQEVVSTIIQCITSEKGKINGQVKDEKKRLIEEIQVINPFIPEDATHLTQVLSFEKARVVTNFETNIKEHFKVYVSRYVRLVMTKLFPATTKEELKHLHQEIGQVIKVLMNNTPRGEWNCPPKYHQWITENKPLILPEFNPPKNCSNGENTHYYHVLVNPQAYFKHMIYVNLQLEALGEKQFRCFPMRSEIIPKHITIDTRSLITLLVHPHVDVFTGAVMKYQEVLWNAFFDVSRIKRNGYLFNHMLVTDGYVASVCLMDQTLITKKLITESKKKAGRQKQRDSGIRRKVIESPEETERPKPKKVSTTKTLPKQPEFLYMDEVDPDLLTGAEKTFVIDAGKRKLLSMMETKTRDLYSYTNRQRLHETKRLIYRQRLHTYCEKNGILALEKEMEGYNSKTCLLEEFRRYMEKKIDVNNRLYELYEAQIFRQYQWYGYINNLRSDRKLLQTLLEKTSGNTPVPVRKARKHPSRKTTRCYPKKKKRSKKRKHRNDNSPPVKKIHLKLKEQPKPEAVVLEEPPHPKSDPSKVVLIFGDWSVGKQMRNFISTPNVRLMRLLKKNFQIYYLDEYRTSCLHWKTEVRCEHLSLPDNEGKIRSRHSILTYQMENKRLGCIDRDRNACQNMIKLYDCHCSGQERLYRYRRGVCLDDK